MKLNQKLVEQLAKGKTQVEYDGNPTLLTKVLRAAFPTDNGDVPHNFNYYYKSSIADAFNYGNNAYMYKTIIPLSQFLQPEGEIIGYLCPMDLFDGEVKKGEIYITTHGAHYTINGRGFDYKMPKEIVETWQPIYAEPQPEVKEEKFEPIVVTTLYEFLVMHINGRIPLSELQALIDKHK
jgi:hypothetical protein